MKVPGFIKFIPHILKQTGRYSDGRFDPNHIDFESFCGLFHTKQTALPLAIAIILYYSCISTITYFLSIHGAAYGYLYYSPLVILLILGIWKEKPRLMLPFIVLMLINLVFQLVVIPFLFIALFTPDSAIFHLLARGYLVKETTDIERVLLVMTILTTFHCVISGYIGWSMWIHYCYIRGCQQMAKEEAERNA